MGVRFRIYEKKAGNKDLATVLRQQKVPIIKVSFFGLVYLERSRKVLDKQKMNEMNKMLIQ